MEPNLPIHLTSFVGRERDVSDVARLLEEGRVITLVGPAGCGKTRLAIEVARPLAEAQADGAWFVDLAPLSDPALLAPTVGAAMGIAAPTPDLDHLARHLAGRQAIVLLDNAEHLVDDVASAAEALVQSCPRLRLLITSRESLRVEGEWTYRVDSLAEQDAISLFVDRARQADTRFTFSDANAETVAEICRRLDGIPLALELSAACTGSMGPERILQRLDERFQLLMGGRRTSVARHRTMRAALEWSEALLSDLEQRLFRRLSVFVGDFDVDSAEKVVGGPDLPVADVLPLLRQLVERSVVLLIRDGADEHYRLLETLREFGRERLVVSGEADALALSHARHYTALAHSLADNYHRTGGPIDPVLVDRHLTNFRMALQFAADQDGAWLADLAGALAPVWLQRPRVDEGRRWMEAGLAFSPAGSTQRFRLLAGLVDVAVGQGDFAAARLWADEALQNRRQSGDERGTIQALLLWGVVTAASGDNAGSLATVRQAVDLARRLPAPHEVARGLNNLAMLLMGTGQDVEAEALALEAVEITRTLGSSYQLDARLDTLASAHLRRGRIDAALAALREAILSPNWGGWDVACVLATMAAVLIDRGQPGRGVRLAGAIERHCERLGLDASTAWSINRGWLERGLAVLGHQAAAVRASGRRLSLQEAKAYALTEVSGDEPGVALRLSRREIQVAGLVREGLSNRTIAERLVISERTVEGHVSSLLNKVRVQTRAQVPAWVVEGATEGLLTVLFTDIVGSTELTARRGDDEARATRDLHDRLVREQLAIYGGREVQTTGDGFLVTFNSVRKAIACACAIQGAQLVQNQRFPDRALSVRLGLHTGEVSRRDDGLFGSAVNLAARVMSKAGPGDVLVSDVAKRMAGKVVDVEFRDRGRFQLRGFPARHRLYEVVSSSERALHTDVQPLQTPRPGDQAHA